MMSRPARGSARRWALSLWLPALFLICWEAGARTGALNPLFFPAPTELAATLARMVANGDFWAALEPTLSLMFRSYIVGSLCGTVCGLLMGVSPGVRYSLDPMLGAVWAAPKISLLPILMLFFGIGDAPRLLVIAAGSFIVMAFHSLDAVRGVSPGYVEMARCYGAGRLDLVRKVYAPAALPLIFSGLRLALGRALTITIAVELVSAEEGLGGMIWLGWQSFATERLYIGVLTAAALGGFFHLSLRALESRLIPWRREAEG